MLHKISKNDFCRICIKKIINNIELTIKNIQFDSNIKKYKNYKYFLLVKINKIFMKNFNNF